MEKSVLNEEKSICDEASHEVLRVRTERTLGQILVLSISLCLTLCVAVICVIVLFPGHKIVVKNAESPSYCDLFGNLHKNVEDFLVTIKSHWRNAEHSPIIAQESETHEACSLPKITEDVVKGRKNVIKRDVNTFYEMTRRREKDKVHKRRADARFRTIRDEYLRCKKESKGDKCEKIYEKLLDVVRDIDDKYVTMNKWVQEVREKKTEQEDVKNLAKNTNINVYSYATKIDVKNVVNPNHTYTKDSSPIEGDFPITSATSATLTTPTLRGATVFENITENYPSATSEAPKVAIVNENPITEEDEVKDPIVDRFSGFSAKVEVPRVKFHEDLGNRNPFDRESFMRNLIPGITPSKTQAENEANFRVAQKQANAWRKSMQFDQVASGPFFSLCEDYMKQKTPSPAVIPLKPESNRPQTPIAPTFTHFWPLQPSSNAFSQSHSVPVTGEASKATSQVVINPASSMGLQSFCFFPQTSAVQNQPTGQWGSSPINYGQYYSIQPRISAESDKRSADTVGNGLGLGSNQVVYCSFLPSMALPYSGVFLTPKSFRRSLNDSESAPVDRLYASLPSVLASSENADRIEDEETICEQDGTISCHTGRQCIAERSWCDSKVDCLDGSDELMCSCRTRLNSNRICDGYLDCPFGEDEMGCFGCEPFSFSCFDTPEDFERYGHRESFLCYTAKDRCDGIDNCLTGKDERDCAILARNLESHSEFFSSNSKGVLFKNHEGSWYPVCGEASQWTKTVCPGSWMKSSNLPSLRTSFLNLRLSGPFLREAKSMAITDDSFTSSCAEKVLEVECEPMKCGIKYNGPAKDIPEGASSRVVGGLESGHLAWPFIVAIYKNGVFVCGGTIFNPHWIITAAHCVHRFERHYFEVRAGMLRKHSYSPITQITKISHVIPHHEYDKNAMHNDIALLRTDIPLQFNNYVRPICLPELGRTSKDNNWIWAPKPGTLCTALGWGAVREKGPASDQLQEVQIPILPECKDELDNIGRNLCAGEKNGGRDACQGDSGGPLLCQSVTNSQEWYLAGVISHGEGCARHNEPGVYTRVALYLEWIHRHVNSAILPDQQPKKICPGFICIWGGLRCIPKSYHCDQQIDCLGGEDEVNCEYREEIGASWNETMIEINSSESEEQELDYKFEFFNCFTILQKINLKNRCDHIVDCDDGTDEVNCTCRDYLQLQHRELICDGRVDCSDGTDEDDCELCFRNEYRCGRSGTCIAATKRCDGVSDCPAKEDEEHCWALTQLDKFVLDRDHNPTFSYEGFIIKNKQDTWSIVCEGDSSINGMNASEMAVQVCTLLGFSGLSFVNSTIIDSKLMVEIENDMGMRSSDICSGLFVRCSPQTAWLSSQSTDGTLSDRGKMQSIQHNRGYPWRADIYVNGKMRGLGVLINSRWIATDAETMANISLTNDYVMAVLGISPKVGKLSMGLHVKILRIDCLKKDSTSNFALLHAEKTVEFGQNVLPASLISQTSFNNSTMENTTSLIDCIVVYHDSLGKLTTVHLPLHTNCSNCSASSYGSGAVFCGHYSWYFWGFVRHSSEIRNNFSMKTLPDSCDKHYSELPCEGHRCSLGKCLKPESICNGKVDCPDGSDEWVENCPSSKNTSCPITELKCANGKCIPKQQFCNRVDDCGDLSDEPDECSCSEYFRLTNPGKICDGFTNCYDKDDENNQLCECSREKFFCGSNSNFCVPREMVCDGIRDCPDGEDEEHCTGIRYPLHNSDGFGEIVEQSFGMWHTKCFSRQENLNRTAIGGICMDGNAEIRVMDDNLRNELDNTTISTLLGAPTKAVVANKFSPLQLNDDFVVFIKPSKSVVDVSEWSQEDYRRCIRVGIRCK